MRVKRLEKCKRKREKTIKRLIIFSIFIPALVITAGYAISSLLIIPVMAK